MSKSQPIVSFLKSIPCQALTINEMGKWVTIPPDATLSEALKKMIEHKILSVPILEEKSGYAIGILSVMDILIHLLNKLSPEKLEKMQKKSFEFFSMMVDRKELEEESVKSFQEMGQVEPIQSLSNNSNLYDVVELMVSTNSHRVIIYDDEGKFAGLITQSRIIQLLSSMSPHLEPFGRTIEELQIGNKNVFVVSESTTALKAFEMMKEKGVSGLGVVNKQGALVGNISANDLKLIGFDLSYFNILVESVHTYLTLLKKRQQASSVYNHPRMMEALKNKDDQDWWVVTCRGNCTLDLAMRQINYYRVHRVFVVDEQQKPVAVISLCDILQRIIG